MQSAVPSLRLWIFPRCCYFSPKQTTSSLALRRCSSHLCRCLVVFFARWNFSAVRTLFAMINTRTEDKWKNKLRWEECQENLETSSTIITTTKNKNKKNNSSQMKIQQFIWALITQEQYGKWYACSMVKVWWKYSSRDCRSMTVLVAYFLVKYGNFYLLFLGICT